MNEIESQFSSRGHKPLTAEPAHKAAGQEKINGNDQQRQGLVRVHGFRSRGWGRLHRQDAQQRRRPGARAGVLHPARDRLQPALPQRLGDHGASPARDAPVEVGLRLPHVEGVLHPPPQRQAGHHGLAEGLPAHLRRVDRARRAERGGARPGARSAVPRHSPGRKPNPT